MGPGLEGARVESRSHFFAIAAKAMHRVLVDHARPRRDDLPEELPVPAIPEGLEIAL